MTLQVPEVPPDLAISFVVLRLTRGLNQEQVAKAAGITSSALSEYERGRKSPELKSVRRIVEALGYRLSALERIEDLLRDLELESLFEAAPDEEGGYTLVPAPRRGGSSRLDGRTRGRKIAALVGQAATGFCLLLFDLLGSGGATSAAVTPMASRGKLPGMGGFIDG
jgi:transcriptional regulator with XRE-family HTH domain